MRTTNHRIVSALVALALAGCLVPEKNIDRTRVVGVVRVEPERIAESKEGQNSDPFTAVEIEPLAFGWRVLEGTLTDVATDEAGEPTGDADCWSLVSPVDRGLSTDPEDETAADVVSIVATTPSTVRVTVYDLETVLGESEDANGNGVLDPLEDADGDGELDLAQPTPIASANLVDGGTLTTTLPADVAHALCVTGIDGAGSVDYTLAVDGRHPDQAGILVGVYEHGDPEDRGALLGGTNALGFVDDGLAYVAPYEMLFLRKFQVPPDATDTDAAEVLDEDVKEGWLYAGTWPNLSQKLPAGTWYSSQPIQLDLGQVGAPEAWGGDLYEELGLTGGSDTAAPPEEEEEESWVPPGTPTYPTLRVEDSVVVDTVAPILIGQQIVEVEPNDMPSLDPTTEGHLAQDLGVLSGPGFVDVVTGQIDYLTGGDYGYGYGYWGYYATDEDTFKFQVPEPVELGFTLSWSDPGTDLDIFVLDAAGEQLGVGYFGFPEVNELSPPVLQPGQDYYVLVLLWYTPGAVAIPWELQLEQIGQ